LYSKKEQILSVLKRTLKDNCGFKQVQPFGFFTFPFTSGGCVFINKETHKKEKKVNVRRRITNGGLSVGQNVFNILEIKAE
jgi:hypothetical protein